jgi:flagellar FliJ protein
MQKVLEFTQHTEDKEKAILKEMQFKHQVLCLERDKLKKEYQDLKTQYEIKCNKGIAIKEMMLVRSYISEIVIKTDEMCLVIKQHEGQIDQQIMKLIAISREKTIMEKLKGKYYGSYKDKKRKAEEIFIDDFVANSRYSNPALIS